MKTAKTFIDRHKAYLAKDVLEQNSILCFILDENLENSSGASASGYRLQVKEEEYQKALKILEEDFYEEKYSTNSSSPKLIINLIASAILIIFIIAANRDTLYLYKNFTNLTIQDKNIHSIELGFRIFTIIGCIGLFLRKKWSLLILLIGLFKEIVATVINYDYYVSQLPLFLILLSLLILILALVFFSSKWVMNFFMIRKRGYILFSAAVLGVCFVLPGLAPTQDAPDTLSTMYLVEKGKKLYYNGSAFTGKILDRYKDGKIDVKGFVKDGVYEGSLLKFYPNGNKEFVVNYKDGEAIGKYQEWYSNGKIKSLGFLKDGLKDSLWKEWYPNGEIKLTGFYKKEIKVGKSVEYYKTGNKKEEAHFSNGLKDGAYSSWFEDGTPNTNGFYVLDKKDSIWTEWLNNKKFSQEFYRRGKRNGPATYWNKEGIKIEEGFYEFDLKSGKWTLLNREGEIVEEKNYKEGILLDDLKKRQLMSSLP